MADGSSAVLYAVPEVTNGTTPTTPAFVEVPFNSDDLAAALESIESERLGGRHMRCHRLGNKSADGSIATYLYPAHLDSFLEAALCGTWTTNALKTGKVRRSFTFERQHTDNTPITYLRFLGCEVNEFTLTATAGQNVTASLGIVGTSLAENHAMVAGATYTATPDTCPYDAWSGSLEVDSAEIATATELSITIANGIERLYGIGSRTAHRKSIGKVRVTGNLTMEFLDTTEYAKWYSEQNSVLELTLEAADGNSHVVRLPALKYTEASSPVSAEGQVTVQLAFVGEYDDTDESEIVVTRTIPTP